MRVEDLMEAPLPDDWDSDIFNPQIPFSHRLRYAQERAEQVGRGSSRVVFKIPYQGRPTALKIAVNRKGAAQNEEEARLFEDWFVRNTGVVVPMIDYDEQNAYPTWIHTEYAPKVSKMQLRRFFGEDIDKIIMHIDAQRGNRPWVTVHLSQEMIDSEAYQMLADLLMNFTDISAGDLTRKANWGVYRGSPVIVDLGLTESTLELYA